MPTEQKLLLHAAQTLWKDKGYYSGKIDGIDGPLTETASNLYEREITNRIISPVSSPNDTPNEIEEELNDLYGRPGENLVTFSVPYPLKLSWELHTTVSRITLNKYVKDSALEALENVLRIYGSDIDRLNLDVYGGSYNLRKKRGGTSWSTHAWGIAVDFDPDHNQLDWDSEKAAFSRSEYTDWWNIWYNRGWYGLGPEKNFDWMHIQKAKPQ